MKKFSPQVDSDFKIFEKIVSFNTTNKDVLKNKETVLKVKTYLNKYSSNINAIFADKTAIENADSIISAFLVQSFTDAKYQPYIAWMTFLPYLAGISALKNGRNTADSSDVEKAGRFIKNCIEKSLLDNQTL